MAFRPELHDLEKWLVLENENLLQKVCNIFDDDGILVEQYKTRVTIVPVGFQVPHGQSKGIIHTTNSPNPSLYRSFNLDDEGNLIGSVPQIREWTQACESAATGGGLDPETPVGTGGLKIARSDYVAGVASSLVAGTTGVIISKQLLLDEAIYLRHVPVSGENQAKFQVLVDGSPIQTKRTWFGDFNADMWFNTANGGILFEDEELIQVQVLNCGDEDADFEGSIGFVVKEVP